MSTLGTAQGSRGEATKDKPGGRMASLDGLRGIAIIAVVLAHHGLLNSGWAGVDLFFVLSGFLITSLLRRARSDFNFWSEFYVKRATRILPPLLLFLTANLLLGNLSVWYTLACLLSFGDVVAVVQKPASLLTRPLWSLAVEEHFYLVWPFAVRYLRRKYLIGVLIALVIAEPLIRMFAVLYYRPPTWELIYHLTPFRLDGLLLGSFLAIGIESPRIRRMLGLTSAWATIALVSFFVFLRLHIGFGFTKDGNALSFNVVAYLLIALIAFFILAHLLTHPTSKLSVLLAWRPLVFMGRISYGLYLYHLLIRDCFMRFLAISPRVVSVVSIPTGIAIAWASFSYIEKPLISWGHRKAAYLRAASESVHLVLR